MDGPGETSLELQWGSKGNLIAILANAGTRDAFGDKYLL